MRSLQNVLCEPLMLDPRAIYGLIDESRIEMSRPDRTKMLVNEVLEPTVQVTLYDADAMRLADESETTGHAPGSLIAVVPLAGVITRHGYAGWFSSAPGSLEIGRHLQRLDRDDAVGVIVLSVDSPGGSVYGTAELSKLLFDIREKGNTRTIACVDPLMASAATYIASAADEVYAIPSAEVGSIGVISSYSDYSGYLEKSGVTVEIFRIPDKKARFSGVEPMDDDMRETTRERIKSSYELFVTDMARNRGVSEKYVRDHFGQGEVMSAAEAVDVKLIDGVSSMDEVLAGLASAAMDKKRKHMRQMNQQRLALAQEQTGQLETVVEDSGEDTIECVTVVTDE